MNAQCVLYLVMMTIVFGVTMSRVPIYILTHIWYIYIYLHVYTVYIPLTTVLPREHIRNFVSPADFFFLAHIK